MVCRFLVDVLVVMLAADLVEAAFCDLDVVAAAAADFAFVAAVMIIRKSDPGPRVTISICEPSRGRRVNCAAVAVL